MRVIFVSSGLGAQYGGAPISEASLASNLRKHCDVTLLCNKHRFDPEFLKTIGDQKAQAFDPWEVVKASQGKETAFSKLFDGADVLHLNAHWQWENYFFAKLAQRKGIPYVLHPRGICHVTQRKRWRKQIFNAVIGNSIVRSAERIILLSLYEAQQVLPYGVPREKLIVIPNGITMPESDGMKTGAGKYFLYYGRLEARKNLLFLLDAFAKYRASGGKAALWCMGPAERGYDLELQARAKELKAEESFKLVPATYGNEKWKIIRESLAVVYPSENEPFGRVPFEALAAGVLPVVPVESGSAEYLKSLIPQCLFPQGNADKLADVLKLVESGKDLGLEKARAWVARDLSWDKIAMKVFDLYVSLSDRIPERISV